MEVVLNHQKLPWISQVDHLGHIIHESGSQEVPTLDHLLKYWEFSISAHHCKSNLLCKLILLRRFVKFAQSILHSWNPLIWEVGSISAYFLQRDFGSYISNISGEFSLDMLNSLPRAIYEECGPLTIQERDNIECLLHLLLQLRNCEEDDIRDELKSWKPMFNLNYIFNLISEPILS